MSRKTIDSALFSGVIILIFAYTIACTDSTDNKPGKENEIEQDTIVPKLIGTRGKFRSQDHEHTIQSLNNAPPWVDGVYINMRLTSDEIPVLMHDYAVDRTTNGTGPVNSLSLAQIKALDAGGGAEVPTLEEYLQNILILETDGSRRSFSRIFLNPREESLNAITIIYNIAMDSQFDSLKDRYTWLFNNLLENGVGAANLRTLDDTCAIGTFLSDAGQRQNVINALAKVNGTTILLWPQEYNRSPETLQVVTNLGFEGGLSRISSQNLHVIPKAYEDPNVKALFTWNTDELSWWYSGE